MLASLPSNVFVLSNQRVFCEMILYCYIVVGDVT